MMFDIFGEKVYETVVEWGIKHYKKEYERELPPDCNDEFWKSCDEFYKKMNEEHIFGSNCLPSIDVENLDVLKNKIKDLKLCFPLTKINNNWVVEFVDSEGNHIELTAPIK